MYHNCEWTCRCDVPTLTSIMQGCLNLCVISSSFKNSSVWRLLRSTTLTHNVPLYIYMLLYNGRSCMMNGGHCQPTLEKIHMVLQQLNTSKLVGEPYSRYVQRNKQPLFIKLENLCPSWKSRNVAASLILGWWNSHPPSPPSPPLTKKHW